ncbi:uncharacterized protein LOC143186073 [Calliopsis andreniformis]|uniref:uncharacterized protein LOC143186073 n=1 Tax=Calliopsis andreniformis TaxID=337506 RepID=UPI003FCD2510
MTIEIDTRSKANFLFGTRNKIPIAWTETKCTKFDVESEMGFHFFPQYLLIDYFFGQITIARIFQQSHIHGLKRSTFFEMQWAYLQSIDDHRIHIDEFTN